MITLSDILRLLAVDPRSPGAAEWLTWAPAGRRGVEQTKEALLGGSGSGHPGRSRDAAGEGAGA